MVRHFVIALAILAFGVMFAASMAAIGVYIQGPKPEGMRARYSILEPDVITLEHDGHRFIWANKSHGGNLMHHPDCPCLGSDE